MERPEEQQQRVELMRQRHASRGGPVDSANRGYVNDFNGDQGLCYNDDDSTSWDHCVDEEEVYHGQYTVRNLCIAFPMNIEGLTLRYSVRIITFQGKEAPGT